MKPNKTLFEKLFPYHIDQVRLFHGEENTAKYIKKAKEYITSLSILLLSAGIILITLFYIETLSARTLSKVLSLCLLVLYLATSMLMCLKDLKSDMFGDEDLIRKWCRISVTVILFAYGTSGYYIISFANMLDFSRLWKEKIEIEELGIKITIPKEWSKAEWSHRIEGNEEHKPLYAFKVTDDYQTFWMEIHGWEFPAEYTVSDHFNTFRSTAARYFHMTSEPQLVELHGIQAYKAIGTRRNYPNYIYILYATVHNGTKLIYRYRFQKRLDHEQEFAKADSIFASIEFTKLAWPDYIEPMEYVPVSKLPPVAEKRQATDNETTTNRKETAKRATTASHSTSPACEVTAESVHIHTANMKIFLPRDSTEINWKKKNSTAYVFDVDMGGYPMECDLTVVWTSEKAKLGEFEDEFNSIVKRSLGKEIKVAPQIKKLSDIRVYRAAGNSAVAPDNVTIHYYMIHRGARLELTASIPPGKNYKTEMKKIESFIERIDFY